MFAYNVNIPGPQAHGDYVQIFNEIPKTVIEVWQKKMPHNPQHCTFRTQSSAPIRIPTIRSPNELLHTNLEIRIMNLQQSECLRRVLCWQQGGTIYIAPPNDKERNIDNLGFDCHTTRRVLCKSTRRPLAVRLRSMNNEYFICSHVVSIPIEYLY